MSNKFTYFFIAIALMIVGIMAMLHYGFFDPKLNKNPIKKLSDFSIQTIYPDERIITSAELSKEYYIVNFMASWCDHCIHEIDELNKVRSKINAKIIAIVVQDSSKNISDLFSFKQNPFDYIAMDNSGIALNFGSFSLPQTFIVNNNNEIVFKNAGVISAEQFEQYLVPYLNNVNKK